MGFSFSSKRLKYLGIGIICVALVGLFVVLGPTQLLAKSETPEFCASCHVIGVKANADYDPVLCILRAAAPCSESRC